MIYCGLVQVGDGRVFSHTATKQKVDFIHFRFVYGVCSIKKMFTNMQVMEFLARPANGLADNIFPNESLLFMN